MNKLMKWAVALVTAFLFGALSAYYPIKRHFEAKLETLTPQVVEVIKIDTLERILPTYVEKRVVKHDSVKIALVDTIMKHDTLYLPREQKVYGDSTYRAYVSGISPRLDSIFFYQKEITKIRTRREYRKWDYGIQGGVGIVAPVGYHPSFGGYIGFGINYHF